MRCMRKKIRRKRKCRNKNQADAVVFTRKMIESGEDEAGRRKSWKEKLEALKKVNTDRVEEIKKNLEELNMSRKGSARRLFRQGGQTSAAGERTRSGS